MLRLPKFMQLPFPYHLTAGALIRLLQICYGEYHDQNYDLAYTDVDYKVFSDAARHVYEGESPYNRHTYRYSPIIAYLLVPNLIFGKNFGKVVFSVFDILVAVALKFIVDQQFKSHKSKDIVEEVATFCCLFWLYNPLVIGISTRGNADSVTCFFITLSILFLQTDLLKGSSKCLFSGIFLGVAIHLRLYPLAFSFPMFLSLGEYEKINNATTINEGLRELLPNRKQMTLTLSCISTLFLLTSVMYLLYGYEFLFESYFYHLFRKDTRHNFSILFYYAYMAMDNVAIDIVKIFSQILECTVLFMISLTFGCDPKTLPFALFCEAFVIVSYNSVLTSQYFIWFLSLLPLIVHDLVLEASKALILTFMWVAGQAAWLYYAYLLEFQCREIFILLWFKSVVFFCINVFILSQLIKMYSVDYGFGMLRKAK